MTYTESYKSSKNKKINTILQFYIILKIVGSF